MWKLAHRLHPIRQGPPPRRVSPNPDVKSKYRPQSATTLCSLLSYRASPLRDKTLPRPTSLKIASTPLSKNLQSGGFSAAMLPVVTACESENCALLGLCLTEGAVSAWVGEKTRVCGDVLSPSDSLQLGHAYSGRASGGGAIYDPMRMRLLDGNSSPYRSVEHHG
jgi:hypothetical protein